MKKIVLTALLLCLVLALTGCACKHAETQLTNQKDPTCDEAGYTGDTVCLKCNEVVTAGAAIDPLGHKTTLHNQKVANCVNDGYSGDEICSVCGDTVAAGSVIPAPGHGEIIVENAYEPTCEHSGFTGMKICTVCSNIVEDGVSIPALGHTPAEERVNAYEPGCEKPGYTGNLVCAVCGDKIENGEEIPALGHTPGEAYNVKEASCIADGYTGDSDCTVCGETTYGEIVDRLAHNWVDGVCADCGWITPGLYIDGKLAMDWEKLVSGGYLTLQGKNSESIDDVQDALYGLLVIDESITEIDVSAMGGSQLDEIWTPCTMHEIGAFSLGQSAVKTVRLAPTVETIGINAFSGCILLEEIVIPEGVTAIPEDCFNDCVSLRSITLPDTLVEIDDHAFYGCQSLGEISFPEGLKHIGWSAFARSGLTTVTLPASVEAVGMDAFNECPNLTSLDFSAAAITDMFECARYVESLKELKLPHGLVSLRRAFSVSSPIEELILPDTLTELDTGSYNGNRNTTVRTIVWPVSLKEAEGFHFFDAIETIYYKGSELEWSLINNIDGLGEVNVVFNYTGE